MIASSRVEGMSSGPRREREGIRDAAVGSSRGMNGGYDIVLPVNEVDKFDVSQKSEISDRDSTEAILD